MKTKICIFLLAGLFTASASAQFVDFNFPSTNDQFFQCSKFGNPAKCKKMKKKKVKKEKSESVFTNSESYCENGRIVRYYTTGKKNYMEKTWLKCQ